MKQIKAQGDYPPTFSTAPKFPHDVCGSPFLWHFVTLGAIRHHIWHDSIAETTLIFIHKNRLTAMMRKVVLQVATKV